MDATPVFSTTNFDGACGLDGYLKKTIDVSAFADGSQHTVEFRGVLDSFLVATNFFVDDVSLLALNHAPVLASIGNGSVDEGQSLDFQIAATDADGEDSLARRAQRTSRKGLHGGQRGTFACHGSPRTRCAFHAKRT
jgi:hypothetical protein